MGERNPTRLLVIALVWLVIAGAIAVGYKLFLMPAKEQERIDNTGSTGNYRHDLTLSLDSFSGYALLRSEAFHKRLRSLGVRLTIEDDGADYPARLQALAEGRSELAVFTVDSYLAAGARLGEFPGSIVLVIDETRGADAMVSHQQGLPTLQDLDDPAARIVLTPDSPSEFLARVAVASFNLPALAPDWSVERDGAEAVYRDFAAANPASKRAYVLWEPYVSKAMKQPGAVLLLDSSKLRGYILDVLVVERKFLSNNHDLVKSMVQAYLQTLYEAETGKNLSRVVLEDAGGELTREQADQLVEGIEWRNTTENYAHFGLLDADRAGNVPLLEDSILKINQVLLQTGALAHDPIEGRANTLFYDRIFRELKADGFHPSRPINIVQGAGPGLIDPEELRGHAELPALVEAQWQALKPVGEMRIPNLSFGRGSARLNPTSQRNLAELARTLESFPAYYVKVLGTTRKEGDPEANRRLAQSRADAAAGYLREAGVHPNRVHAHTLDAANLQIRLSGGQAQSVLFVVGETDY